MSNKFPRGTLHKQAGFTIVELMVATVVFSTVLIVITTGVMYFTRSYHASLNRSRVQNTARSITASISQGIQFTGTVIATTVDTSANPDSSGVTYFCAGGKIYVFRAGQQYGGGQATQADPGLYVAPQPSGCTPLDSAGYNDSRGQQMLGPKMRITSLSLRNVSGQLYSISLTLAYGDDDLLTATTGSNVSCRSQAGSQFCAVSSLNTTVQRRLQDGQLSV